MTFSKKEKPTVEEVKKAIEEALKRETQ